MGNGRDGFSPLGFNPACLLPCEEVTLYTRVLEPNETYRVDELFVPKYLLTGKTGIQVLALGYEGRDCDPVNRLLSVDPVPIDAFAEYPLENFDVGAGERVFVKLRNINIDSVDVMLAVRGLYRRLRDG